MIAQQLTDTQRSVMNAQRIVVKVGTNVVMRDTGEVAIARLYTLVESIAALRRAGRDVVLVSSGAIGLGTKRLALLERPKTLAFKQACAAVGQGRLMALYAEAFDRLDVVSAQILLTEDDFSIPERYHNLRATLDTLLGIGVVPIINENDTVSTLELERTNGTPAREPVFGDNDKLSALIAVKIQAQLLILLSDIDGLFTANPVQTLDAQLVPVVKAITPDILASAKGSGTNGRGGMVTKLEAAKLATASGTYTVIANGRTPGILDAVCGGAGCGTVFLPEGVV